MEGLANARPPAPRPYRRGVAGLLAVLSLLACGGLLASAPTPAHSQELTFPTRPAPVKRPETTLNNAAGQKQMLVQAAEIDYDYTNNRVYVASGGSLFQFPASPLRVQTITASGPASLLPEYQQARSPRAM